MDLAENTVVAGRFRLVRLIGRGGMGSVWEAIHLRLDMPCAVKFMAAAAAKDALVRFEREAKAAAQLRSPNVVQILDHGICDDGTPYIAMELLDGEDLGKRLARLGCLAPHDLIPIVNQVCRALGKAHQLGIVHRDLKPDNVFLVKDDDREIAKVLDFGIAKSRSHELGGSSTKTGAMLGTPFYMSPEQAQGTKDVDYRTDLWAMAVICFEALTGARPFVSEALGDLLVKIIVSPLPMPSEYAQVPPGFDGWWVRAASRDPAERFQSAREFAESLALACGVSQDTGVTDAARLGSVAPPPMPNALPVRRSDAPPAMTQAMPGTGSPVARSSPSLNTSPRSRTNLVLGAIAGSVTLGAVLVAGIVVLRSSAPAAAGRSAPPAASTSPLPIAPPSATVFDTAKVPPIDADRSATAPAVTLVPVEPPTPRPQAAASVSRSLPQRPAPTATAAPGASSPPRPKPTPTYNPGI